MGFECIATPSIPQDYGAPCQASCRQHFRHGNSSTIERMTQDAVLRSLRAPLPLYTRSLNSISTHARRGETPQTPQNIKMPSRLNTLRCGRSASKPRRNSAKLRAPRRRNSPRNPMLRLRRSSFRMMRSSPSLWTLRHHSSAERWIGRRGPRRWTMSGSLSGLQTTAAMRPVMNTRS